MQVGRYHGDFFRRAARRERRRFMGGELQVMSTNAFGLSVDQSDIRFVLHAQMPGSIEAYYQESGRGGRDGEVARCTLIYDLRDRRVQQFFLARRYPDAGQVQSVQQRIAEASAGEFLAFVSLRESLRISPPADQGCDQAAGRCRCRRPESRAARVKLKGEPVDETPYRATRQRVCRQSGARSRKARTRMVFYAQDEVVSMASSARIFRRELEQESCGTCDNCIRAAREREPVVPEEKPLRVHEVKPRREYERGDESACRDMARAVCFYQSADQEVTVEFPNGEKRTFLRSYVRRVARTSAPATSSAAPRQ